MTDMLKKRKKKYQQDFVAVDGVHDQALKSGRNVGDGVDDEKEEDEEEDALGHEEEDGPEVIDIDEDEAGDEGTPGVDLSFFVFLHSHSHIHS